MTDQNSPSDFSVEAILAAHGREVVPSDGAGRHSFRDRPPVQAGSHRLEDDDLGEGAQQAPVSWWRRLLSNYGLVPPMTASR
jgi:hypothetical protein